MKRFAFLSVALMSLLMPGSGQILFHDDFQNATNRFSVGDVASSWTLYNDDHTPTGTLSRFDKAWNVFRDNDGSSIAVSVSYFSRAGQADRWLVSPAIDLGSANKPVLVFRAKRMDTEQRDGFEVKISTSGKEKEDFTASCNS